MPLRRSPKSTGQGLPGHARVPQSTSTTNPARKSRARKRKATPTSSTNPRVKNIKAHVGHPTNSATASETLFVPNERTKINRMTDNDEYLDGAEYHESTIRLLKSLIDDLDICNKILERDEDIVEDSVEDDEMADVAQVMILVVEALESVEESKFFNDLLDTAIGEELLSGMKQVREYILKRSIFSERDDHEVCTKAMELLDVISRLVGEWDE